MKLQEYFSLQEHFSKKEAKTPFALSQFLNVQASSVYCWLKKERPVPPRHCAKIERFTNGAVTCEELAPSFNWNELWAVYRQREDLNNRAQKKAS